MVFDVNEKLIRSFKRANHIENIRFLKVSTTGTLTILYFYNVLEYIEY